mgnify:CR=1 FL=1
MKNIEVFAITNAIGESENWVKIDRGNNEFSWMPKAVWDELEAQKENGTIS